MVGTAAALLGSAAIGAIGGALQGPKTDTSTRNVMPAGGMEQQGSQAAGGALTNLQGLVAKGPGQQDVANAAGSQRSFASQLMNYSNGGFMPSQQDQQMGQQYAQQVFDPQRQAMNQNFQQQIQQANQQAGRMGRDPNDPVFRNQLSQTLMGQQAQLSASQNAFGAQFAMQMPDKRLGYQAQANDVNQNLSNQAMQNQSAIFSAGRQVVNSEQQFRLGAAGQTNTAQTNQPANIFNGALAGVGGAASLMNAFNSSGSQAAAAPRLAGGNSSSFANYA